MIAVWHGPVRKRLQITAALPHKTTRRQRRIQIDAVQRRIRHLEQPLRRRARVGPQLDAQPEGRTCQAEVGGRPALRHRLEARLLRGLQHLLQRQRRAGIFQHREGARQRITSGAADLHDAALGADRLRCQQQHHPHQQRRHAAGKALAGMARELGHEQGPVPVWTGMCRPLSTPPRGMAALRWTNRVFRPKVARYS
jgi:hypothetical protein